MRMIRLGRTNASVSAISLGTWGYSGPGVADGVSVGWSGHDDQKARDALVEAHLRGIRHWDTADAYGDGHAEELIGDVFDAGVPRGEIFLASKFGWVRGPHDHFYDPGFMRQQCERSLRNLRTDVIDLYYFHHCDFGPDDRYLDGALETMRRLRQEGKIRFIGLSDWSGSKIMRVIERVDPDVVQPYRNVIDDDYEPSGLKAYVDGHDLGVAFFSPIMHGLLLGKYDAPQTFPEGDFRVRVKYFRDAEFIARTRRAKDAVTQRFTGHPQPVLHALTAALLAGNDTACVLLGQRNRQQVDAAAECGDAISVADAAWVKEIYHTA